MDHLEYKYLYPARPETKIVKTALGFYEGQGYWAQKKKNGTNTVIHARGAEVIFKTRDPNIANGDHRQWNPLPAHKKFFAGPKGWNVINAELLHNKTVHIKNELFIFDVYVLNGVSLYGTTFAERQQMLHDMYDGSDEGDVIRLDKHVTLAKCFDTDFQEMFETLKPEDEGLVLKDPNGVLRAGNRPDSNRSWQVKCRIPHANYSF